MPSYKEEPVSSETGSGSTSSGRKLIAIVCIVIAVLAIIAGLIYAIEPAKSLPAFMGQIKGSSGHRALRMSGSFIVGIVLAAAAWVALAYKPKPQEVKESTPENTPAGHN
jgi:amino acid permease